LQAVIELRSDIAWDCDGVCSCCFWANQNTLSFYSLLLSELSPMHSGDCLAELQTIKDAGAPLDFGLRCLTEWDKG